MEAREEVGRHSTCSVHDPCDWGDSKNCPLELIRQKRTELKRGEWSRLVIRREPGGLRHYLDEQPVRCGVGLELQSTTEKSDDYGEFTVPLQAGSIVRYEAQQVGGLTATLHLVVGGHEFVCRLEPWMRFRWLKRGVHAWGER